MSGSTEVLRDVFDGLYCALDAKLHIDSDSPSPLQPIQRLKQMYGEAIDGRAAQVQITVTTEISRSLKTSLGISAKIGSLLAALGIGEIGGTVSTETSKGDREMVARTVTVQPFGDYQLVDLIECTHALVRLQKGQERWKTLLVIDDFDILKRRGTGFDPWPLLQAMYRLSQMPGLFVLTTVREDTYETYRNSFHRVAQVGPFATSEPLQQVYRRHVDRWHAGRDPFRGGFVEAAASRCEGRVGLFLEVLREVYDAFPGSRLAELANLDFEQWLARRWESARTSYPEFAGVIMRAVARVGRLTSDETLQLQNTSAHSMLLWDYSSEDYAIVRPELCYHIRREQT